MKKLRVLLLIAATTAALSTAPERNEARGQGGDAQGWIDLFNGKDLTGWKHVGPGSFTVEDGALVSHGGMGLLYYDARAFGDFMLAVEWKVRDRCNNSGIFVRFPQKTDDPWYAVRNGYEIQIDDCDKNGLKYQTGSIFDQHAATRLASKPAGEWNKYEITIVGQHYSVVLNGEKVNEFDGERGREGYIGLQNHDPTSVVSFRRVSVKEIR
ncbi:MAG TPA: DUF1080 domain-containing protein [Blastocatellia bacterium]|nr:DUF1080 domain-containing protein [Blastocatellia bacterium]